MLILWKSHIGHISSLPTTHELLNTKNKLQKKLDFVDDMLTEKLELGISVDVEDPSTSNSDVVIIPGQKSPDLKNIDLSCSDDCYCDRCIQVKYAIIIIIIIFILVDSYSFHW